MENSKEKIKPFEDYPRKSYIQGKVWEQENRNKGIIEDIIQESFPGLKDGVSKCQDPSMCPSEWMKINAPKHHCEISEPCDQREFPQASTGLKQVFYKRWGTYVGPEFPVASLAFEDKRAMPSDFWGKLISKWKFYAQIPIRCKGK